MAEMLKSLKCGFDEDHPCVICNDASDDNGESSTVDPVDLQLPDVTGNPNLKLLPQDCGISFSDRMTNMQDDRTSMNDYTWMVLLSYQEENSASSTPSLGCGGTIITEWWVLTAANCVLLPPAGKQLTHVVLGEWDLTQDPDCDTWGGPDDKDCRNPIETVAVDKVVVHPRYIQYSLVNDIALLKLYKSIDFDNGLRAICLPTTRELQRLNYGAAVVAGWNVAGSSGKDKVLLQDNLRILNGEECNKLYLRAYQRDHQICADSLKWDSLNGKSGGPLMALGLSPTNEYVYVQQGIISAGSVISHTGTDKSAAAIYTRLAYYMDWVLATIGATAV